MGLQDELGGGGGDRWLICLVVGFVVFFWGVLAVEVGVVISGHKIRATVFKGRKPSGDSATWVVEPVAAAIDALEQLTANDYLFTPTSHQVKEHLITAGINDRLSVLRDRISQIRPMTRCRISTADPGFPTRQFRRILSA